MEAEFIDLKREGLIATIVLSRPEKLNRLDTGSMKRLVAVLQGLDVDPDIRVVVITGMGKAFCAGADIREFEESGVLAQRRQAETFRGLCLALHRMRTPVVAKVNGIAIGGGMAMVSLAHLAVASREAQFGTPEINVGAFPSMVMSAILRSVPRKRALKMILMGEMVGAEEALEIGLVNAVVPPEELDRTTASLAQRLASKSPSAMTLGLDSIRLSSDLPYPHALEYLQEVNTLIRNTEDFREGSKAFVEKRKPVWKGL